MTTNVVTLAGKPYRAPRRKTKVAERKSAHRIEWTEWLDDLGSFMGLGAVAMLIGTTLVWSL